MLELLQELAGGLVGVVLGALVDGVLGYLRQRSSDRAREDLGAERAKREGAQKISEIAGEQNKRSTEGLSEEELLRRLLEGRG